MKILINDKGFTLLEMMVSLILVAMIAATSMSGIRLSIGSQEIAEKTIEDYQRMRFIRDRLTNSLRSLNPLFYKEGAEELIKSLGDKNMVKPSILAFEGEPNSIKFITFAEKLNSFKSNPIFHEVRYFVGTIPGTEQTGLIMSERDFSHGEDFNVTSSNASYVLLSSDMASLKFRFYKVEKLDPKEKEIEDSSLAQYKKTWVNRVVNKNDGLTETESGNGITPLLKNQKISLPRAIEVTIGMFEENPENESEPRIVQQPPMIINLNSGMVFEKPEIKDDQAA